MPPAHLERALAAEEKVEELEARIADLVARLKLVLGHDPTSAIKALSWMSRAENGEQLIREIMEAVKGDGIRATELPAGWASRAEAQLKSLEILKRDQASLVGEAIDPNEAWEQWGERGPIRRVPSGR